MANSDDFVFASMNIFESYACDKAALAIQKSLEEAKAKYMELHQVLGIRMKVRMERRQEDDPTKLPDVVRAMRSQEKLVLAIGEIDQCLQILSHIGEAVIKHDDPFKQNW